jgi:hypothetical protein
MSMDIVLNYLWDCNFEIRPISNFSGVSLIHYKNKVIGEIGDFYCVVDGIHYYHADKWDDSKLKEHVRLLKLKAFW